MIQNGELNVLKQKQAHSNQLKAQLDALLERVFSGPTPEFPDEDQLESDVARCLGYLNDATRDFPMYQNILGLLSQAESEAQQAVNALSQAGNMNTVDMFSDSRGVDLMKQSMIQRGREHGDRCNMVLNQCRQVMPGLPGLANINLSGTDLFLDVIFDNIFTFSIVAVMESCEDDGFAFSTWANQSPSHLFFLSSTQQDMYIGQKIRKARDQMAYNLQTISGLKAWAAVEYFIAISPVNTRKCLINLFLIHFHSSPTVSMETRT